MLKKEDIESFKQWLKEEKNAELLPPKNHKQGFKAIINNEELVFLKSNSSRKQDQPLNGRGSCRSLIKEFNKK